LSEGLSLNSDVRIVGDTQSAEYRRELKKAADDFEGILVAYLFRVMRTAVPKSEFFGETQGREIYEDLLFTEIAAKAARAESMGIAEMLYRSFLGEGADAHGADDAQNVHSASNAHGADDAQNVHSASNAHGADDAPGRTLERTAGNPFDL
jgi:Rod binding domain-containing protein